MGYRSVSRRLVVLTVMVGSMLAVAVPAAWAVEFSPSPDSPLSVGERPEDVATGDFDGDGDTDLAVANSYGGLNLEAGLSVLLRRADGSFDAATNFRAGLGTTSVASADFDGNGDPDLALVNESGPQSGVVVLLGQAGGNFGAPTYFSAGNHPRSLVVGDFDDDSDPDLAVANSGDDNVTVLLGQAGGDFAAAPGSPFAAGDYPESIETGDFDGDPYPDLAVANLLSDNVSVLSGAADGSFGVATNHPAGDGPASVAAGDFDGDLDADLAVGNYFSDNVSVLMRGADGGFGAATAFPAGDGPYALAVEDFDGDEDPDLAVANRLSANLSVLPGGEGGGFGAATNFPAGDKPSGIAVADFDSNLDPDLAVTNFESDNVSVLMNASVPEISPSSSNLAFGSRPVGTIGPAQTVTLTNTGQGHLNISGAAITGANPGDFIKSADTCAEPVAPGQSCAIGVRFAPEAVGARSATLRLTTDAPNSPTEVALSGSGSLVAHDDSYSTDQDRTLTVNAPGVLADDDAGPSPTALKVSGPSDGTLALDADGSFTYTPAPGFSGSDSFEYRAAVGEARSNVATVLIRVRESDTTAPTITATTPTNRATAVSRTAPLTATFSEKMDKDTIGKVTFKLYRINPDGTTRQQVTNVVVELSSTGLKAKLDPFGESTTVLAKNTKYKAMVTTGAKDLAGNSLDQNPNKEGSQPQVWTFTTGAS